MANQTLQGNNFFTAFATLFSKGTFWVGVGQEDAWDGAMPPPSNSTGLPNPIVYKKIDIVALCKAVNEEDTHEYSWNNDDTTYYYKTVTDAQAVIDHARWVYLEATLNPELAGLASFDFRAVAFYYDLVPTTGNESATVLLPNQVSSVGNILLIDHDEAPTTIGDNKSFTVKYGIQVGG